MYALEFVRTLGCEENCPSKSLFDVNGHALQGHYEYLHTCIVCNRTSCWGCLYAGRAAGQLCCLRCSALVVDDIEQSNALGGDLHAFTNDIINGDFSATPLGTPPDVNGEVTCLIARYVLRNQLHCAAEYSRIIFVEDTEARVAGVVAKANELLSAYDIPEQGGLLYRNAIDSYNRLMTALSQPTPPSNS